MNRGVRRKFIEFLYFTFIQYAKRPCYIFSSEMKHLKLCGGPNNITNLKKRNDDNNHNVPYDAFLNTTQMYLTFYKP